MKNIGVLLFANLIFVNLLSGQTLKDAIKQTTNEQFETADATFKSLVQREPTNGEYYFYWGENFFKDDKLEQADAMYQKGININATHPLCYVGAGKVLWFNKKETEAKTNFFKATTLSQSKNATVFIKIAEAYIIAENKNITEAINLLNQAAKLTPQNPEVYILMGDAYLEQNNGSEAIKQYEKAMELDKTSVTGMLRIGQLWNRAQNYNLALDYYKKASAIDSFYAPAFREKAEIYFRAGQYQNAVAQYQKFLALNNNLSARTRYTGFLYQAKKYKEAIDQGTEVFKNDSSNIYLYRYLGYSYYENNEHPNGLLKMEGFFRRAGDGKNIKIISKDYEYYGKLLAKTGKDSLGIINLQKAYSMDTTRKDLYSELGAAYIKMKKFPEAIAAYNKKISTSAKPSGNDYFGLGRAYYLSKDFVNADSAFIKITRSNPDLPTGYLWRAKTISQMDVNSDKWLAKPYYESFIAKVKPEEVEKNKKDLVEAYTYMAAYYAKQKDLPATKAQFQKIIEIDPTNAQAKKFLSSPEAK